MYRSDDTGFTWTRVNDAAHQFVGLNLMAAAQNVYGSVYAAGGCRGIFYGN